MPKPTSLKKNTIANYIGQFYTMFIGIFMLPFYLEYLGAEAYGLVGFFTMLMSWMAILDMGFSSTLAREAAKIGKHEDDLITFHKSLRTIETFFLFGVSTLIILLLIFSNEIAKDWLTIETLSLETVTTAIQIMAIIVGLRLFVALYQGGVIGFENQVWLNGYKIILYTLRFGGAFIFIKYITDDIVYFFLFQLAIAVLEFFIVKRKLYNLSKFLNFVAPSFQTFKILSPFALSVAYGTILWMFITQIDKLMLSHYLSLKEYGYFSLVVVVANAVMLMFQPIGQAILPRMTNLITSNRKNEAIDLYRKATQFVSIIIFSVVVVIVSFPQELLYVWTGNNEASIWAANILVWYVLGNGVVAFLTLLYYLQHAHGNLKYHIKANSYFGLIQIIFITFAVHFYGAIGAGITFFVLQLMVLLFWSPFVHGKFLEGVHYKWLLYDIFPYLFLSLVTIFIFKYLNIYTETNNRIVNFILLVGIGGVILMVNIGLFLIKRRLGRILG